MNEPYWSDEKGVVKGYMCKISFDHELGHDSHGTKIYPTVEALEESQLCVSHGCGIAEVEFKEALEKDNWPFVGYMEHVCFYYEAGAAKVGAKFYPNENCCREHEPYASKYGVVRVQLQKVKLVQEEDGEKMLAYSVNAKELDKWQEDKDYQPLYRNGKPVEKMGGPENWDAFFSRKGIKSWQKKRKNKK